MKRLVLLGGGHAHLQVLADLGERPLAGWAVHLVSPNPRQIYSGMLPGWIAGHYALEACAIALGPLAARAGARFHETACTALDLGPGCVHCADGTTLHFDALSIDTGPEPALGDLPGATEHALPVRPLEHFIAAWPALEERIRSARAPSRVVVVGAGAAGVEVALALRRRAEVEGWTRPVITALGPDPLPLPSAPLAIRQRASGLLSDRGIAWRGGARATRIEPGLLRLQTEPALPFDACLVATGAAAPAWPSAAGLATDPDGFIRVDRCLRSVSHPAVFAAGDVAAYADPRPKSGVYAVRAGPVLSRNLRAFCAQGAPEPWTPQRRALYLVSAGDRHALATWGRWSVYGRWVWHWKDAIDRRFVRRFAGGRVTRGAAAAAPRPRPPRP